MAENEPVETDAADLEQVSGQGVEDTALPNARELESLAQEYPAFAADPGSLPQEVRALRESGLSLLEACRLYDLRQVKGENKALQAQLAAQEANRANAQAAIGSLAGGQACEKDYYTSAEWDRLPKSLRETLIRSGKIFEFMRKWSGKE